MKAFTCTDDLDANLISLFTILEGVSPIIPAPGALGERFPAFTLADLHGINIILLSGLFDLAVDETEGLADSRRPVVVVPKIMAANWVVFAYIQYLGDKGNSFNGRLAVLAANGCT